MYPNVDVGLAAEVPDHRWPFYLPHVPDLILANVLVLVV
jgi:hypothetical protein